MKVPAPKIITCSEWGARPPRQRITPCGRPNKALIHHTAGHHPEIGNPANESKEEAIRYARDLQRDMMDNRNWIDSGHNFLVCRNGMILQGRWGTITAIEQGHMVVSAHCPGENDQPGIEHEHLGSEAMTPVQFQASAELLAWICDRTGIRPTQFYGHGHFYPTDCPANLNSDVPKLRLKAASILTQHHTAPDV